MRDVLPAYRSPEPISFALLVARLLQHYGAQGWWPLREHVGTNPTSTGSLTGYHPGDYSYPRTSAQQFEIACGAILTQNTAWPNVELALERLAVAGMLDPSQLVAAPEEAIERAIRSSGYFRVKTRKLQVFGEFFLSLEGRVPSRGELLAVWGVGPETADCIRLYAYGQVEMVVDAYTKRVLCREGYCHEPLGYDEAKRFCVEHVEASLPAYQEFHALMVEHGKRLGRTPQR